MWPISMRTIKTNALATEKPQQNGNSLPIHSGSELTKGNASTEDTTGRCTSVEEWAKLQKNDNNKGKSKEK